MEQNQEHLIMKPMQEKTKSMQDLKKEIRKIFEYCLIKEDLHLKSATIGFSDVTEEKIKEVVSLFHKEIEKHEDRVVKDLHDISGVQIKEREREAVRGFVEEVKAKTAEHIKKGGFGSAPHTATSRIFNEVAEAYLKQKEGK